MALLFADPCGKFYATTTQASQGIYNGAPQANIVTSGLPAGAIESTAFATTSSPCATINVPTVTGGPYTMGLRVYYSGALPNSLICVFNDASGNGQLVLNVTSNGALTLTRGNGGTNIFTSASNIIKTGQWMFVEFQCFCSTTVGNATIRVNNSVVGSVTNVNTSNTGTGIMGQAQVWAGFITYFQDVYVTDNTILPNNTATGFLGDVSMVVLNANRQGTFNQYTPSGAGTNWQAVADPVPDDITTISFDSTPGDRVSFGYAGVATTSPIVGVIHVTRAQKGDSGARTFAQTLTSNGVDVIGPTISPGTTFAYSIQPLTVDPATGQTITITGVNALQGGVKTIS